MTSCLPASWRSSASRSSAPRCTSACRRASLAAASPSRAAAAARWHPSSCCRRSASPRSRAHCSCSRRLPRASAVLFSSARDSLDSASCLRRRSTARAALQAEDGRRRRRWWVASGRLQGAGSSATAARQIRWHRSPQILRLHGGGRAQVRVQLCVRGAPKAGWHNRTDTDARRRLRTSAARQPRPWGAAAQCRMPAWSLAAAAVCLTGGCHYRVLLCCSQEGRLVRVHQERRETSVVRSGQSEREMGAVTSVGQAASRAGAAARVVRSPSRRVRRPSLLGGQAALTPAAPTAWPPPAAAAP